MLVDGNTVSGGGLTGRHVPLPTTARPLPERTRRTGLDWAAHTTGPDPDAIARLTRLGIITVTHETVEDKPVRVVRKTGRKMPTGGGRKKIPLDVEAICQEYRDGSSVRDIAKKHHVASFTVRQRLRGAGVEMRPAHGHSKAPDERLIELHGQGLSLTQIAEETGVTYHTVWYRLRGIGVLTLNNPAPFDVDEAIRLYGDGMSTYDLSRRYGVGRKLIGQYLRGAGVALRMGGSAPRVDTARVVELAAQGWSQNAIGRHLGVDARTVRNHLARAAREDTD